MRPPLHITWPTPLVPHLPSQFLLHHPSLCPQSHFRLSTWAMPRPRHSHGSPVPMSQDLIHFTSISELPHSPFTGRIDVSVSMQDKTLLLLVGVVPVDVNLYLDPIKVQFLTLLLFQMFGLAQMRRQYFHQCEPRLLPSFLLQWDQSLKNWTGVLIRCPGSWVP